MPGTGCRVVYSKSEDNKLVASTFSAPCPRIAVALSQKEGPMARHAPSNVKGPRSRPKEARPEGHSGRATLKRQSVLMN